MILYPWEYLSVWGVCDPKEVLRWDPSGRLSVGQATTHPMGNPLLGQWCNHPRFSDYDIWFQAYAGR